VLCVPPRRRREMGLATNIWSHKNRPKSVRHSGDSFVLRCPSPDAPIPHTHATMASQVRLRDVFSNTIASWC
jgi:hypothetical protein